MKQRGFTILRTVLILFVGSIIAYKTEFIYEPPLSPVFNIVLIFASLLLLAATVEMFLRTNKDRLVQREIIDSKIATIDALIQASATASESQQDTEPPS